MESALIIFVRSPVLGKVKTRLAKDLGDAAALEVYIKLLKHTHAIISKTATDKFVFYADYINENDLWENHLYQKKMQEGNDLGERMKQAFTFLFQEGYSKVLIIGSDCYELTAAIIDEAFARLSKTQTVIGPATDGGYYLIGMNTFIPALFENKNWSTNTVFEETMKDIRGSYTWYLLPQLTDIDTAEDLAKFSDLISLSSASKL